MAKDERERVKGTLGIELSARVLARSQRLTLTPNQFVNLAVEDALAQMEAVVPAPARFIRNYRCIVGLDPPQK